MDSQMKAVNEVAVTTAIHAVDLESMRRQLDALQESAGKQGGEASAMLDAVAKALATAEAAEREKRKVQELLEHGAEELARRDRERQEAERTKLQAERTKLAAEAETREAAALRQVETILAQLATATATALDARAALTTARNMLDTSNPGGNLARYSALRAQMANRLAFILCTDGKLGGALEHGQVPGCTIPLVPMEV